MPKLVEHQDHPRRVLLITSTGLRKEWVDAMRPDVPDVQLATAEDTTEAISREIEGSSALINCPRRLFSDELLQRAPNLEWIHVGGAGCEEFLIPSLVNSDIVLTNGKVIQGPEVADHALALVLALTRNLHYVLRGRPLANAPRPIELRGKVALVIGLGGIGMLVAERLHACGMTVNGVDPGYVPMVQSVTRQFLPEQLLEALPGADVVVVAAPRTDRTYRVMNAAAFAAMKRGAIFVAVSRGTLIDTAALVQALQAGQVSAAGLDVTDPEPLDAQHPLRAMDNVIVTPHIAGLSDHNRERSFTLIRQNVANYARRLPLINIVDKERGY